MTHPSFDFSRDEVMPPEQTAGLRDVPPASHPSGSTPGAATMCDKLAAFFKSRPEQWIDGVALESIAGRYAWRSRVSDLRRQRGMTIENRQRTVVKHNAACNGARNCICRPDKWTVSEYRFVPEGE